MIDGGLGIDFGFGVGVGEGVGVGVGAAVGVGTTSPGPRTTNLKVPLAARVSESIMPGVRYGERSTVDVVMQYCTGVPAG